MLNPTPTTKQHLALIFSPTLCMCVCVRVHKHTGISMRGGRRTICRNWLSCQHVDTGVKLRPPCLAVSTFTWRGNLLAQLLRLLPKLPLGFFFIFFYMIFYFMHIGTLMECMSVWTPLELEIQALQWWAAICVLGTEPRSSVRAASTLNHRAIFPPHLWDSLL